LETDVMLQMASVPVPGLVSFIYDYISRQASQCYLSSSFKSLNQITPDRWWKKAIIFYHTRPQA